MIKSYKKGVKVKVSENFNSTEFDCKCKGYCNTTLIDTELVEKLQMIRSHFGSPLTINSAYRCDKHNAAVGGATKSKHKEGMAADIVVKGVAPAEVAKYAESIGILGIGLYETSADGYFVHVDTRTAKSFWYGQKQTKRDTFGGSQECKVTLPVVKKGDVNGSVQTLQNLLNVYNNAGLTADGNFGSKTYSALTEYQKSRGLPVTGICDEATWSRIIR